jgi:hypothetical protein
MHAARIHRILRAQPAHGVKGTGPFIHGHCPETNREIGNMRYRALLTPSSRPNNGPVAFSPPEKCTSPRFWLDDDPRILPIVDVHNVPGAMWCIRGGSKGDRSIFSRCMTAVARSATCVIMAPLTSSSCPNNGSVLFFRSSASSARKVVIPARRDGLRAWPVWLTSERGAVLVAGTWGVRDARLRHGESTVVRWFLEQ